ncbi:MAG: acyl-CoA desaturase [Cyclobacteriaceae bacterium]
MKQAIRFSSAQPEFYSILNLRVNEYFKSRNLSRNGNAEMALKTIFMFTLYLTPYFLMMFGVITNVWWMFGMCIIMGIAVGGIGLAVMHDANHGSYSNKPWVNNLLGLSLNAVGGSAFNWKVQHNVLHHTYTNIHDVDEDISPRGILRMSPHGDWKSFHRFQHFYAWFFYGLLTLVWVLAKDFLRIVKYHKEGLVKKQRASIQTEWTVLIASKIIYIAYVIIIPALVLSVTWWQILIGFSVMHYIAGFILAIIFQPAHVIDGTEYPQPDENGRMDNNWAIHQLRTTTNFANNSRLFSWYVGGLNFQVEHHLFPNVCHVHYRKISPIVESTAKEFGLPYKAEPTFLGALIGHAKLLKQLGEKPPIMVKA